MPQTLALADIDLLDTSVGMVGTLSPETAGPEVYEMLVSLVLLVYETTP